MIVNDDEARRPESRFHGTRAGWSGMHSWIFLAIVAIGFLVIGIQNRYHYLSPLGLGKAYRIDKLFGGIQEYDPDQGWVLARLQSGPPPTMSMMSPPQPPGPSVPMQVPGTMPPPSVSMLPEPAQPPLTPPAEKPAPSPTVVTKKLPSESPATPKPVAAEPRELSQAERMQAFTKEFPDFGKEEFALANDDLYPHWKKSVAPKGTWPEFLKVYGDFVKWWNDQGQPPEPGFKLWRDYLATRPKN